MAIKIEKKADVNLAAALLRKGKLVAFPTETVYGLGADASNEMAVRQIFKLKERPLNHPLIVHIGDINQLSAWAKDIPDAAFTLAHAFWPGPLTIVLKKAPHVLKAVTGGQETIALRIPKAPLALSLLKAFGGGIAAPSANLFTRISATSAEAVVENFGDKIDLILDGGLCELGIESTIIDLTQDRPRILRAGMISAKAVSEVLQEEVIVANNNEDGRIEVPGSHHVHYAPLTKTLLMKTEEIQQYIKDAQPTDFPMLVLKYSEFILPAAPNLYYVKMPDDAKTYAHQLYRILRALDREEMNYLIIEAVPEEEAWVAIQEKLQKASAPRT